MDSCDLWIFGLNNICRNTFHKYCDDDSIQTTLANAKLVYIQNISFTLISQERDSDKRSGNRKISEAEVSSSYFNRR